MTRQHRAREPKDYRIILQHDACEPLVSRLGPVSKAELLTASIDQFRDAPVDVYASDVNHAGGVHFNSRTCERHSTRIGRLACSAALQMTEAIQQMLDEGTEPLRIYCEGAHARGIDYMARVRMNDLHDVVGVILNVHKPRHKPSAAVPELYYHTSKWRLDHPEYLMGDPTADTPKCSYEYWERSAPNYALGPVREHMLNMIEELVHNYDLDAVELDFVRMPFNFLKQERYAQRHVMTGVIRQVKESCVSAGEERGRPIRLSVRVPDTAEMCLLSGYDLPKWLKEGYLDMVTIGGGYCPFDTPWRDIVSLCDAAGVPAFACLNHGQFHKDRQMIRAAASRAYASGVTGFELWNFFYCMDYYQPPGQNPLDYSFVADIASQDALRNLAKTYVPGDAFSLGDVANPYDHATWPGQLPMTIGVAHAGVGNTVTFDVFDDMAARASAVARLEVDVVDLGPTDELLFFFNGRQIESDPKGWQGLLTSSQHHFEFDIPCSSIAAGENTLELRLVRRDERLMPFISLSGARLSVPAAR